MWRRNFLAALPAAAAIAPLRGAAGWPRYPGSEPLALRIPERHPYLCLTPAQIERIRQRASETPWIREEVAHLVSESESAISIAPDRLPKPRDVAHRAIGG